MKKFLTLIGWIENNKIDKREIIIDIIIIISVFTLAITVSKADDISYSEQLETNYIEVERTIKEAQHINKDMATRMCEICKTKIAKYSAELNSEPIANEMEIKTLETYKHRLHVMCTAKNMED